MLGLSPPRRHPRCRDGEVVEWLYQSPGEFDRPSRTRPGRSWTWAFAADRRFGCKTPLTEADVRKLKAGDVVLLSGTVFTGRDAVHHYLHKGGELDVLQGGVIYHCGPVVLEEGGKYRVVAAGPTTSIREEPYQAGVIDKYGVQAVIGKGGMGPKTLRSVPASTAASICTRSAGRPRFTPGASSPCRTSI